MVRSDFVENEAGKGEGDGVRWSWGRREGYTSGNREWGLCGCLLQKEH